MLDPNIIRQMRDAQKEYERTHSSIAKTRKDALERAVDQLIELTKEVKVENQTKLL